MKRFVFRFGILALAILAASSRTAAVPDLLSAVRAADVVAVREALAQGADPNAKDSAGASALMHAVIYAPIECMQTLINAGADVNGANQNGSTALIWAGADTAKLRLLLDHGANVNARTNAGVTPIVVAARYRNVEGSRLLLSHGADVKDKDVGRPLSLAVWGPEGAPLRDLFAQAGFGVNEAVHSGATILENSESDASTVKQLLDAGADAKERITTPSMSYGVFEQMAHLGFSDSTRLMVEHGAGPMTPNERGYTPLMFAAGSQRPDVGIAKLFLDKGVDINARNDMGQTAFDLAMLQGEGPMTEFLRQHGARRGDPASATPRAVLASRSPAEAARLAIAKLQPAGPVFNERTKCISCHTQSIPAMAVAAAREHGVPVNAALARHPTAATLSMWQASVEKLLLAAPTPIPGFVANVGYGMAGMAEEGVASNFTLDAVAIDLAAAQRLDGSWMTEDIRPPLSGNPPMFTALAIRALDVYMPPGRRPEVRQRIARGLEYLNAAPMLETEDEVFKLLGLAWGHAPTADVAVQRTRVAALQRADGGWAQRVTLASDAYATGQALNALKIAGLSSSDPIYQKGTKYLLRTQLEDGTWFVQSRAIGFQLYFETGFPHGRSQFISSAATAWAALALTHTIN